MYLNWLRRNSNHDYCKKKPKVTGILRNYSIPAVINNLVEGVVAATPWGNRHGLYRCQHLEDARTVTATAEAEAAVTGQKQ
jgi:hypothetical protein